MLPFQPETTEAIVARVPAVLKRCFDVEAVNNGSCKRPGELREHVFDFAEGLRCIVSLDYTGKERPVLHISCSSTWTTELGLAEFLVRAKNMHCVLFPDVLLVEVHTATTGKAIHLVYDVPDTFLIECKRHREKVAVK